MRAQQYANRRHTNDHFTEESREWDHSHANGTIFSEVEDFEPFLGSEFVFVTQSVTQCFRTVACIIRMSYGCVQPAAFAHAALEP